MEYKNGRKHKNNSNSINAVEQLVKFTKQLLRMTVILGTFLFQVQL